MVMNPASGPGHEGRTKHDTHAGAVQQTQRTHQAKKVQPPAEQSASAKTRTREAPHESIKRRESERVAEDRREQAAKGSERKKQPQRSNGTYSRRAGLKSDLPAGQIFDVKR